MTDEQITENPPVKDEMLEKLEQMLKNMPDRSRQPILDLINKRKVELGLMKSGLPAAGYRLRKAGKKAAPKRPSKETVASLGKIARSVGKVREQAEEVHLNIDVKDEPLRKERKITEETDSYKY